MAGALGRGPGTVGLAHALRPLSLCRRALVQYRLRPRRHHHRSANPVAVAGTGARRAALSRRAPVAAAGSLARSPARQDPARNARRGNGRAARDPVRQLLRHGRRHAAIRGAGRRVPRPHRRRGHAACAMAGGRGRAGLDRPLRRRRRRRLRRVSAANRRRPRTAGLEGFLRLDFARRRGAGHGRDRAVRGPGLCLRRTLRRRPPGAGARAARTRGSTGGRGRAAQAALQ